MVLQANIVPADDEGREGAQKDLFSVAYYHLPYQRSRQLHLSRWFVCLSVTMVTGQCSTSKAFSSRKAAKSCCYDFCCCFSSYSFALTYLLTTIELLSYISYCLFNSFHIVHFHSTAHAFLINKSYKYFMYWIHILLPAFARTHSFCQLYSAYFTLYLHHTPS